MSPLKYISDYSIPLNRIYYLKIIYLHNELSNLGRFSPGGGGDVNNLDYLGFKAT